MEENIEKKVNSATLWSSITEIVAKLITPLTNMILARLLTPEAFGIVATITMVISFTELFTDAGFQKYLIQHDFTDEADLDHHTNVAFWTNLLVSSVLFATIVVFRHQIAVLVGNDDIGNSIGVASVLILFASFSSIQMARFKRSMDFKSLFFVRIITSVISPIVTIPLALIFKNYWALLGGTLASQLLNAIILTIKSPWRPKLYYDFKKLKSMLSFSIWTLLESISIWLTSYIDIFIIARYMSEYYVGLYKTAMSAVGSYLSIISAALLPVLFSALSRCQFDEKQHQATYFKFQRLTALFVIPMGVGIFLYKDLVTQILLGNQWIEASSFVGLWGMTGAFTVVFSHLASEVFRSKGHPRTSLFMQVLHIVFLIPTICISVGFGFDALCLARSLVRVQLIITAFLLLKFKYHFGILTSIKNVVPMIISSMVMGVIGFALQRASDHLIWEIASVLICIIVYFFFLFTVFPSARKDIKAYPIMQKLSSFRKKG